MGFSLKSKTCVGWHCSVCGGSGGLIFDATSPVSPNFDGVCHYCGASPVELLYAKAAPYDADADANPGVKSDPLDGFTAYKKGPLISGVPTLEPVVDTPEASPGSIFSEAEQTINGPRAKDYGDAIESFDRIAALWSAYLNTPISSADVAMMMSLLKMVRLKYSKFAHHDSFVDLLGYVGLAHKVSGEK